MSRFDHPQAVHEAVQIAILLVLLLLTAASLMLLVLALPPGLLETLRDIALDVWRRAQDLAWWMVRWS